MTALTVTAKGQITLKQELLRHLNVSPGDKIQTEKLPDGRLIIRAEKPSGSIKAFSGCLAKPDGIRLSIKEINEIAADGWAGIL